MLSRRHLLASTAGLPALPLLASANQPTTPAKATIRDVVVHQFVSKEKPEKRANFVEVIADTGQSGWGGPIYLEEAAMVGRQLRTAIVGKDLLAYEALWDAMKRADRHSRAGQYMMALSSVDIALWDLRGKHLNLPVYRLLGGPVRAEVPVYASMLGFSTEPAAARKKAREYYDLGFTHQKWFFDYAPQHGAAGFKKNVTLVEGLREELGGDAEIMFDCKWAWDVPYSVKLAQAIRPFRPKWLEEPIRSEHLDGYETIKRDGGVPMAAGEHLYSRWEVKQYLDRRIIDYVQTDPEWCGGITELIKITNLAEVYGVPVIPHGHHIWAALHVVAARPARVCPMAEYLFYYMPDKLYFQKPAILPVKGMLTLPTTPGLGFSIDESKIGERKVLS